MSHYSIEGRASHTPEPIVKAASNVTDALLAFNHLLRVCGRYGTVTVYGEDGREISPEKLRALARAEGSPA